MGDKQAIWLKLMGGIARIGALFTGLLVHTFVYSFMMYFQCPIP